MWPFRRKPSTTARRMTRQLYRVRDTPGRHAVTPETQRHLDREAHRARRPFRLQ